MRAIQHLAHFLAWVVIFAAVATASTLLVIVCLITGRSIPDSWAPHDHP